MAKDREESLQWQSAGSVFPNSASYWSYVNELHLTIAYIRGDRHLTEI